MHLAGLPITDDLLRGIHCVAMCNEKRRSGVQANMYFLNKKKFKKRAIGRDRAYGQKKREFGRRNMNLGEKSEHSGEKSVHLGE